MDKLTVNGEEYIKVKWVGYPGYTWEPRRVLIEDIPDKIRAWEEKLAEADSPEISENETTLQEVSTNNPPAEQEIDTPDEEHSPKEDGEIDREDA